jgi:hypothetical protein
MPSLAIKRSLPAAALNRMITVAGATLKVVFAAVLIVTVPCIAVFAVPAMFPRRREASLEERLATIDAYREARRWSECDIF